MATTHLSSAARTDYDATIADHRRLIPLLHDLEEWLETPHNTIAECCEGLSVRLSHLYARFVPHFKMEEDGPLFKEIPVLYPRFARALERLHDEHKAFIKDAEDILGVVQGRLPTKERIVETCTRAKLLIASLRRHESEENEILQRVYCEDIGAAD